jgi:hypothetical protein
MAVSLVRTAFMNLQPMSASRLGLLSRMASSAIRQDLNLKTSGASKSWAVLELDSVLPISKVHYADANTTFRMSLDSAPFFGF